MLLLTRNTTFMGLLHEHTYISLKPVQQDFCNIQRQLIEVGNGGVKLRCQLFQNYYVDLIQAENIYAV